MFMISKKTTSCRFDPTEAKRRFRLLLEAFQKDGTRITKNLDFSS